MPRVGVLAFAAVSYVVFLVAFLYQIGFLAGVGVPKAINDGPVSPLPVAIGVNVLLLALFAVQHTIMARLSFKRWWSNIVPVPMERSIFVLAASLLLLLMNWQWRPMPETVWHVESTMGRLVLYTLFAIGWVVVLYSSFQINHFDLFGLRQAWLYFQGREYTPVDFEERILYQWIRHPLMLGFIIAFWATPDMTQGHLLFAIVTTAYILIAIQVEERTLLAIHGDDYRDYQQRVSMILPLPPKRKA